MDLLVPVDTGLIIGLIMAWSVIALSVSFRLLNFPDLTIEGSLLIGASVYAALVKLDTSPVLATLCGMLSGGLAGALTGFFHVKYRINKFLAGIIVVAICFTASLRIMGASNIGLIKYRTVFDLVESFDSLTSNLHLGSILLLATVVTLGALLIYAGLSSQRGIRLRVAGSNPEYARSLGISVPVYLVAGLALTNSLAALSGILLTMFQGFADVNMGQGSLIIALAALTIGERLFPKTRVSYHLFVLIAAVGGSLLYQILVAVAIRLGLAATDLKMVTAVLVLVVMAMKNAKHEELLSEEFR